MDVMKNLAATLDEALALLDEFSSGNETALPCNQNFGSLVEQCLALCDARQSLRKEPVRVLHHFACTGGTLFSKCIAAMPNTQLLSEVNPLSTLNDVQGKPTFAPTDMIRQMRQSTRGVESSVLIKLFLNDLDVIYNEALKQGYRLVLREHSHSHYCSGAGVSGEPHLAAMVAQRHDILSVVTVRNPIESFLSLKSRKWQLHFQSSTFDEYCKRYIAFMEDHREAPVFKYEDFLRYPATVMSDICTCLELPFSEQFESLFNVFRMTGDSGRTADHLEIREPRPIDADMASEVNASVHYVLLKKLLGYE
ncbi:hypothetical protein ACW7G0_00840 [Lysobacter sp. A286]